MEKLINRIQRGLPFIIIPLIGFIIHNGLVKEGFGIIALVADILVLSMLISIFLTQRNNMKRLGVISTSYEKVNKKSEPKDI